jgi:hypothetical protein
MLKNRYGATPITSRKNGYAKSGQYDCGGMREKLVAGEEVGTRR